MVAPEVEQQLHGYRGGHQRLATSVALTRADQDLIDRLSDLSGPLAPGQEFDPYLTTYPLPSGTFYVVARTWQDKAATRAGCVLTRSLLVPTPYWLGTPSLPFLLEALRPVDKLNPSVRTLKIVAEDRPLPSVTDVRTTELVEALFLETRQPIVMFEVNAADNIIARLLAALWPGMRRQFATCGFGLGPRSLEGRPFDFLCAPKSSRQRFSDWPGRKIDDSASRSPRHRWTGPAAEQIFLSPTPSLSSFDALGVLQSDMQGDGLALRIALLWNELLEKSKASPNAALGLLDILASQNAFAAARSLLQILSEAVELSRQDSTAFEHLRFLMTLLGKFSGRPMPLSLLRLVRTSADSVSRQDVSQAFEFLASADSLGRRLPRILCAGLADGIAAAMPTDTFVSAFSGLSPETRLLLISASELLDERIVRSLLDNPSMTWANAIRFALEVPATHLRLRAVGRLVPKLDHKDQLPVLQGVLSDAPWPLTARVLEHLWLGCKLKVAEFDDPILRAAVHAHAMQNLWEEICDLSETTGTDRLLIKTLQLDTADLDWLLATETLGASRQTHVLSALVLDSDDNLLGRVFSNTRWKTKALQLLSCSGVAESVPVLKILLATGISSQEEFEIGLDVLDRADGPLQRGLARLLLKSLFAHSAWGGRRSASELVGKLGVHLEGMEIIADATDQALSANQLNFNIELLNSAPQSVRSSILERIDQLCDRIIDFRKSSFNLNSTTAWAGLIADASELNRRAQLRAAEMVLPFSLKIRYGPASPLIIATFPLVHAELARGKTGPNMLSFFFFGDYWDRCDVLRRGLVDAFMKSEWPPADLLVAAHAANVAHEVMGLVSSRYGGNEYQKAILKDLKRLPEDLRDVLRDAV